MLKRTLVLFAKALRTLLACAVPVNASHWGSSSSYRQKKDKLSFVPFLSTAGLEPARISPHAPQTCAYTNSATPTYIQFSIFTPIVRLNRRNGASLPSIGLRYIRNPLSYSTENLTFSQLFLLANVVLATPTYIQFSIFTPIVRLNRRNGASLPSIGLRYIRNPLSYSTENLTFSQLFLLANVVLATPT